MTQFVENKQEMCDALLAMLQKTACAGHPDGNPLRKLTYFVREDGTEIVRPIFHDGAGRDGYYDVVVTGDSNMGILYDVFRQFVQKVW